MLGTYLFWSMEDVPTIVLSGSLQCNAVSMKIITRHIYQTGQKETWDDDSCCKANSKKCSQIRKKKRLQEANFYFES